MATTTSTFSRDSNRVPIWTNGIVAIKSMTLDGGTVNDPGDQNGTGNPATLYTVTGDVAVRVFATCSTLLAGDTATLEVGITGNTAVLLAQTTATDIDAAEVWIDTSPGTVQALPGQQVLTSGTDIIQTVGTADITSGVLAYYCLWTPLSSDGDVVAA